MLLRSLSARLYGIGLLVSLGIVGAALLLSNINEHTRSAFLWVSRNETVIRVVDEMLGDLREAESGQRGFLLTRTPAFLDSFNERIVSAQDRAEELARLTGDDAAMAERVAHLRETVTAKIASLKTPLQTAEGGRFDEAVAFVAGGRGRTLMEEVARRAVEIKAAEESLLRLRMAEAESQARWSNALLTVGGPLVALVCFGMVALLVTSFRRPLKALLASINAFASGAREARAPQHSGLAELDALASAYNGMADGLTRAIERQAVSDAELQRANGALRERGDAIELLGGMAHRMQASRADDEFSEVLHCFLPRVLPEAPGALYAHNAERNQLVRLAEWGATTGLPETFAPDACWGLRRGQSHSLKAHGHDVCCRHVAPGKTGYHCEPILAGGEVVGLLHLEATVSLEQRFRLSALVENIALALVNHRLQRGLREQSIRDPLTELFNRRYMHEVLSGELARAGRGGGGVGVLLCDVDHFKRVNDTYGHEAGDHVLKAVARTIRASFRDGETACRYGGEEFAVIVPETDAERLHAAGERLREAIRAIRLQHDGRPLETVTLSVGTALSSFCLGAGGGDLLRLADDALYRAKQSGRDRVVDASTPYLSIAAE